MIFNTEKKTFENYSNLNNNRIEPALFLINNKSLYVFDNINNLEKESFDFDKTFFLINQTEINIIFLGGNMEKNNNNDNNKNYVFNIDDNSN